MATLINPGLPHIVSMDENVPPTDLRQMFPCFAAVSTAPPESGRLIALTDNESAAAEAFRLVVLRLHELRKERPLKKLLITSTIPQEGKSMVAANLACLLAQEREDKVLLVEGDIRRPSQTKLFGMDDHPGLCELLRNELSFAECIAFLPEASIWILPAGKLIRNPLDLLQSQKLSPIMAQLASWFNWIIIDSPPVLPVADAGVWSSTAQGIVLVTRYGTTQKKALIKGIHEIDKKKLLGTVINCSQNISHSDYYYRQNFNTINS